MNKNQPPAPPHTITIGFAEGNTIRIQKEGISREHAKITIETDGSYFLEDLYSKNGTSVNGTGILRRKVTLEDKVAFHSHEYRIKDLLIQANVIEKGKGPLDFTKEFDSLKEVYDKYRKFQTNERKIKKKIEKRKSDLRLASALIGLFGGIGLAAIQSFVNENSNTTSIFSGFGAWVGVSTIIQIVGERVFKFDEKITKAYDQFESEWKCPNPKCNDQTQFHGKSWEVLAHQKKCKKCNAIWVK